MKLKDHKKITLKQFEVAVKEVLGSRAPEKSMYENKKPSKKELETKWKLVKR